MEQVIQAANLNKIFNMSKTNTYHVLKDINLIINKGEYVTVMGASGSGKSTLLYNLSGMDHITSGTVQFNDCILDTATDKSLAKIRLEQMGFVFQQAHLLQDLSILDNILLPGYMSDKYSQKEVQDRGNSLLDMLQISEIANNKINEASGGQLQRVSIARALINNPDIIFGDEPTGALNSKATNDVLSIIQDINNQGKTVLLVTHDALVASHSERVIFMQDGRVIDELYLGKYQDTDTLEARHNALTKWLQERNF